MRIGLGCMRLASGAPIEAALDAGAVWLDTARAYEGNEELVASVVAARPGRPVKIVTKVGMTRPGGAWEPDGRARTILEQARASRAALGRAPDFLLLHAPDPNVPLATSVRALVRAREEGLALAIGLSNPSRRDLDDLPDELARAVGAIEAALGPKHDLPARAGMLAWCKDHGALLFAHTPLGGVENSGKLARDTVIGGVAARHGATPAQIVLAYLLTLDESVVPIPGARRVETAASAIAAARLVLTEEDLAILDARFPGLMRRPVRAPANPTAEVTIVMGMAGAGKSRFVEPYVARGWERLNRDLLGGTLGGIANRLGERLGKGATRVVLDNTYLTRAVRSDVVRVAHRAGALVRCVFVDISLADARINVTNRMLGTHGALLGGRDLKEQQKRDPGLMLPSAVARMAREVERPRADEGFASIEIVPFTREFPPGLVAGAAVPLDADLARAPPDVPLLVFGWKPDAEDAWRAATLAQARAKAPDRIVELGICTHGDGAPTCWCRPPLPGLWLDFARRHGIDPRASTFVVTSPVHRTMATELGARQV